MTTTNSIARRYFSAKTVRALSKKGVSVVDAKALPGASGSYISADACTGFVLSTNGAGSIRTFLEVLAIAEAA